MCFNDHPMVLENSSTPGTGKGTKTSLGPGTQGANASSTLKEQVSVTSSIQRQRFTSAMLKLHKTPPLTEGNLKARLDHPYWLSCKHFWSNYPHYSFEIRGRYNNNNIINNNKILYVHIWINKLSPFAIFIRVFQYQQKPIQLFPAKTQKTFLLLTSGRR